MSIADAVRACAEAFRRLHSDLSATDLYDKEEQAKFSGYTDMVRACHERFQLWSGNLGAHRQDRNSLDRKLSEASNLQSRVLQYLKDLQEGLEDIIDIVSGKNTPWDELSDSSSDDSALGDEGSDETELEQLIRYVSNTVTCLLRISTTIQKPAPHDRFIKSGKFDQSFRQKWDEQHVSDKFPKIPEWMAIRLGKANSRRRQFLEYRKSQHEQIASLSILEGDSKTVISSLPSAIKRDEALQNMAGSEAAYFVDDLDDRESLTSYAETVANGDALLVPAMPENAKGGSLFECPYCFLIVDGIHNRMQWKRHIYTDMQPYICLHEECMSADDTFARRHSWIQHTCSHWTHWRCNLGCATHFSSKAHIRDHFVEIHNLCGSSDHHLDALSVHVGTEIPETLSCPLCSHAFNTAKRYYRHVGQHLEQLALFVIPRESLEEVDEDLENDEDRASVEAKSEVDDAEEESVEDSAVENSTALPRSPTVLDSGNEAEGPSGEQSSEVERLSKPEDLLGNPNSFEGEWEFGKDAGGDDPSGSAKKDPGGSNLNLDAFKTSSGAALPAEEKAIEDDDWGYSSLWPASKKKKKKSGSMEEPLPEPDPEPEPVPTSHPEVKEEDDPWGAAAFTMKKKKKKGKLIEDFIPEPEVGGEDDPWGFPISAKNKRKKKKLDAQRWETEQEKPPSSSPPPPLPPDPSKEDAMLTKLETLGLGKAKEDPKKEDAERLKVGVKRHRLGALLLRQHEAKTAKEKAIAQAVENARKAAAEVKKKGDEDKLEKLEKLILAQKDEQLKPEAAVEAQRAADSYQNGDLADEAAAARELSLRKQIPARKAEEVLDAAKFARKEAEERPSAQARETRIALQKKVLAEAAVLTELLERQQEMDEETVRLKQLYGSSK